MKRAGESGEGEAEKEETLGGKLRRAVLLAKGVPSTPVRLSGFARDAIISVHRDDTNPFPPHSSYSPFDCSSSARKLAAALWEFQHYYYNYCCLTSTLPEMHRGSFVGANGGGGGGGNGPSRLRRLHKHKDRGEDEVGGGGVAGRGGFDLSRFLDDPSPSSQDQVREVLSSVYKSWL